MTFNNGTETEHSEQIVPELKLEIKAGKLLALSGIIGSGKSTMLRRTQEALAQDKEVFVSKSLSVEKGQISLATLIMALFYDLAIEKDFKIPTQPERRERALRDLIRKRQRPGSRKLIGSCAHALDLLAERWLDKRPADRRRGQISTPLLL